jgi:hypothetical protein
MFLYSPVRDERDVPAQPASNKATHIIEFKIYLSIVPPAIVEPAIVSRVWHI